MHSRCDGIIHLHKNDGQKDHVYNDDKHYRSSSPLQSDNLLNSPIGLSGSNGLDAATARRMSREAGAGLRCGIGASIVDVYLDTVAESDKLQNSRDRGEGQKRSPVILHSFNVVDVACVSKPIRGPCK